MRPIDVLLLGCAGLALHAVVRSWRSDARTATSWDTAFHLLFGAHLTGFLALFLWFPAAFVRSVSEDQWVEWMTFHWFTVAALLGAIGARRRWHHDRWGALAGAALALMCLLVAMEEISWGQRLLGFEAPGSLGLQNSQGEANLHNLILGPGTSSEGRIRKLAAVALLGYGVFLPWLSRQRRFAAVAARLPVATPGGMLVFLAAATAFVHPSRYRLDEIGEYLFGLGMTFVMLSYGAARLRGNRTLILALGWGTFFLLALAPTRFGLGAPQGRAWSREILQYYLYSFAVERFPRQGMWGHSHRVLEYADRHGFENRQTHLLLAQVAREQQDDHAAAAYLRQADADCVRALSQEPESPMALYAASLVQREAQQSAAADSLSRRAVALVSARLRSEPQNDVLRTLLGRLQEDLGDDEGASATFAVVAQHDPSYNENFRARRRGPAARIILGRTRLQLLPGRLRVSRSCLAGFPTSSPPACASR